MGSYRLDGLSLEDTYGVHVMSVRGHLDFLKRKGETSHDWLDEDGEEEFTDADDIKFKPRDITLNCYIKATNRNTFFQNLDAFKLILQSAGLHTLAVPYMSTTFSVYFKDGGQVNIESKWASGVAHDVIGTFAIKLREPDPLLTYY